ncbi:MAG: sterol desaturase family protein [Bryobacterales bacterium]|nr:sterol desaturase family protein [Bryobacterales bacterium]
MVYAVWLFWISLAFVFAERLCPWRKNQPLLRPRILSDLVYLVFNAEYLGILIALAAQRLLSIYNPEPFITRNLMADKPKWLQFLILLIVFDFLQWCVHNALHRIPFLWRFHKVHHSIVDMDWLGDWRFHWGEIFVYRSVLYMPAVIFGFAPAVLFSYGILNTVIGHYAHANLRLRLGPLKYLLNSPQMHIWHHNHPDSGPINRNFGITLSLWDWLFRTAYMPANPPLHLGFEGIETYPKSLPGQWLAPFRG